MEQIRANPADPHPAYAEIYQRLAEDPESPRAALEAELRRRGLLRELRYFTINGLRIMYETWMEYEDENGHAPRDPVEETQVFDNFLDSAGMDDRLHRRIKGDKMASDDLWEDGRRWTLANEVRCESWLV